VGIYYRLLADILLIKVNLKVKKALLPGQQRFFVALKQPD